MVPTAQSVQDVGAAIRRKRESLGLTGQEAARRAGVSPVTWSRVETGRMVPSAATLAKMAGGLGTDLAGLLAEPDPAPPGILRLDVRRVDEAYRDCATDEERQGFWRGVFAALGNNRFDRAMNRGMEAAAELRPA